MRSEADDQYVANDAWCSLGLENTQFGCVEMYPLTDAQAERKSESKRVSTGFSFRLLGVLFELSVLGNYNRIFIEHINRICAVVRIWLKYLFLWIIEWLLFTILNT